MTEEFSPEELRLLIKLVEGRYPQREDWWPIPPPHIQRLLQKLERMRKEALAA